MAKLSLFLLLLVVLAVAGGGVFLANWEIPAPLSTVERVISNDKFPR